jgi:hypothetical protein
MRFFAFSCSSAAVLVPRALEAHAGHGAIPTESLLHYLIEPEHLLPLVLAFGVGFAYRAWSRRRKREHDS